MPHNLRVLLVGAGQMAMEYAKVLAASRVSHHVIGRGRKSADAFTAATGVSVFAGSLRDYFVENSIPDAVIVAVSMDQLARVTNDLISFGAKHILVEKPAGLNAQEVRAVGSVAAENGARVFVAFNRRFYASVLRALEIIEADGGVTSFHFDFTEWSHTVEKLVHPPGVLENWFFANSMHVVDMAFFLGGRPKNISCYATGGLSWHQAAIYSGAGISEKGALFSYHANWCAPGRWMVEVMTARHRLIFKPLEKLQIQEIGSLAVDFVPIDDALDTKFKPGLYRQTEEFLNRRGRGLLSLDDYVRNLEFIETINKPAP